MNKPSLVVNQTDVPWESYGGHGRFDSEDKIIAGAVPAQRLDYVITRLQPGKTSCPYHFHHTSEELFYVLEGSATLRYPDGERQVGPGDFISCPTGPQGAHQFINQGSEPFVYLAISTVEEVDICEYPDSGKVLAIAKHPNGQPGFKGVFRQDSQVTYWEGEA